MALVYTLYNPGSTTISLYGQSIPGLSSTDFGSFVRGDASSGCNLTGLISHLVAGTLVMRKDGQALSTATAINMCNRASDGMRMPIFADFIDTRALELDSVATGTLTHTLGLNSDGALVKGSGGGGGVAMYTGSMSLTEGGIAGEHNVFDVPCVGARAGMCTNASITPALFLETLAAGQRVTINSCVVADDYVRVDLYPSIWLTIPAGQSIKVVAIP